MSNDPLAEFDRQILDFLDSAGIPRERVQLEIPANPEFGERATNVALKLARERKQAPRQIAQEVTARFEPESFDLIAGIEPAGPGFINFRLNYNAFVPLTLRSVREAGETYGSRPEAGGRRIVVEHTSVNPNKEWHIGHVRNAILGDVVTRIFRLIGEDVQVQNYIDDTGLQAAQAIYALTTFPEEQKPGEKFDHYVGRLYVKIAAELAAERDLQTRLRHLQEHPDDETTVGFVPERTSIQARLDAVGRHKQRILRTMHGLESGEFHADVVRILNAQLQTAFRLGVFYNLLNWESDLVASHTFQQAMDRLQQSPRVYKAEAGRYAGAVVIQTGEPGTDGEEPKAEVLIRSNGIPTYVGKDIAYHMWKFGLMPDRIRYIDYLDQPNGEMLYSTSLRGETSNERTPDQVINIIAVDQSLAQATVKEALRVSGYPREADDLFHLAYGLVSTKEGRISGRKGTSVSGDAVIDEAVRVAYDRVKERGQGLDEAEMQAIAEAVGVGAIRYFMVQYNPSRDIVFDVADVVSYDGNTALYIQYALVRMFAMLRRAREDHNVPAEEIEGATAGLMQHAQERRLVYHLSLYPQTIADAARTLNVNLVAEYAYELATIFSQFYRDCGVLNAEPELRAARLLLVSRVRDVLINACDILGVPVIERL